MPSPFSTVAFSQIHKKRKKKKNKKPFSMKRPDNKGKLLPLLNPCLKTSFLSAFSATHCQDKRKVMGVWIFWLMQRAWQERKVDFYTLKD